MSRIPFDVLIHIFFSTPSDNVYDHWRVLPPHSGNLPRISFHRDSLLDPMILSQVCGQWRKAALSTSLLWSSINILCCDEKHLVPILKLWLERSHTSPLEIRFTEQIAVCDESEKEPEGLVQNPFTVDLISLLVNQAHRWKTIDFTFAQNLPAILLKLSPDSLPLLESASIMIRDATNEDFGGVAPLEKIWQVIHSSPSFHSGRWEMEYLEKNLNEVPWAQLTAIDVTMSLDSLIKILPLCHNLLELRFTDPLAVYDALALPLRFRFFDGHHSENRIVLPKLQSLSLKMYHPAHTVLDHLALPALLYYAVEMCKESTERSHAASFKDLLRHSGCDLEALTYDSSEPGAEADIMEILSFPQLSFLVTLDVRHRATDKLIDLLKLTGSSGSILPSLKTYSLGACLPSQFPLRDGVIEASR